MTPTYYRWIKCEWRSFRFDLGAAIFRSLNRFSLIFPSHKSIKLSDWFSGLGPRWWRLSETSPSFVSVASTFCSCACGRTPALGACAAMHAGHWSVGRTSAVVVFLRELVWSPARHALVILRVFQSKLSESTTTLISALVIRCSPVLCFLCFLCFHYR